MTSAHRPTFDHAKGRADHNKTHITHKRFLPAHLQLKQRHAIITQQDDEYETAQVDLSRAKKSVEELKLELIMKEQAHYNEQNVEYKDRYLNRLSTAETAPELAIEYKEDNKDNEEKEDFETRRQKLAEETKDIDGLDESDEADDDDDDDGSEDTSGSEDESEDETEALLKELAKLKKEKEESAKAVLKEQLQERVLRESGWNKDTEDAGAAGATGDGLQQRSWRNETVFSNRRKRAKVQQGNEQNQNTEGFVNDMLRNEFHRKFMNKYVR